MSKHRIIPQMFDVRPVDETGDLDWEKIQSIGNVAGQSGQQLQQEELIDQYAGQYDGSGVNAYILGVPIESNVAPILHDGEFDFKKAIAEKYIAGLSARELQDLKNRQILQEKMILEQRKEEARLLQIEKQKALVEQQEKAKLEQEILRRQQEQMLRNKREQREAMIRQEKLQRDQERARILEEEKKRLEIQQQAVLEKINKINKEKEAAIVAEKLRIQQQREQLMRSEALRHQEEFRKTSQQNRQKQQEYETTVLAEKQKREAEYAEWLQKELEDQKKAEEQRAILAAKISKSKKKKTTKRKSVQGADDCGYFSWRDLFSPPKMLFQFDVNKSMKAFAFVAVFVLLGVSGGAFVSKGASLKGRVLGSSADGLANLNSAIGDITHQNFEGSTEQFNEAYANFSKGSDDLNSMGSVLIDATRFVPFASKLSSGKNAVEAGKHFSAAGESLNEVAKNFAKLKNPIDTSSQNDVSLLDVFKIAEKNIGDAKVELDAAQQNINRINVDDLPEDKRDKFVMLKQQLPELRSGLDFFLNNSYIFADLLGGNGPRKYLFLFQNNSEMRATGGFIGSYGLMDIANGHVKKFFIDGIFNPDGQLREKIVPPAPIQKISASWSMHDSNWFPDFPTSAKKAISFYEKTGGPTADGVITFTPTVMQKLLEITGPIEMPEYDVTLDSKNFIEMTQYKVEVDYDKAENKPKKILGDLAPLVLEKLLSSKDLNTMSKTSEVLLDALKEKHILFYSENADLERIISAQGWSGEMLPSSKDYLSVINSNINGYKTDAVVDEKIGHKAEIQADGSIVDTVTITRKHNGGNSDYEWLNKVNADYMRVYVPEGSKLLEVSGQTRETDKPPLDYDALGFKRDPGVEQQEDAMEIDPESGTRIYNENGKTVFANWTYVSSGESMTITYKYLLPFALFKVSVGDGQQVDSYSLVAQKQAGSLGSEFDCQITYPASYNVKWNFPLEFENGNGGLENNSNLKADRFQAVVFQKSQN